MTSLIGKFKTSAALANSGVWIDFPNLPNSDGTIPGFLMARKSSQNKAYNKAIADITREHANSSGVLSSDDMTDAQAEAVELDVFTTTLLLDWRNVCPFTEGNVVVYSAASAKQVFGSADWHDLRADLTRRCSGNELFNAKRLEVDAKN